MEILNIKWEREQGERIAALEAENAELRRQLEECGEALVKIKEYDCFSFENGYMLSCWMCDDEVEIGNTAVNNPDALVAHDPDCPHRVALEALAALEKNSKPTEGQEV